MPNHIYNKTILVGSDKNLQAFKQKLRAYQISLLEGERPLGPTDEPFSHLQKNIAIISETVYVRAETTESMGVPEIVPFSFRIATPMPPELSCTEGSQGSLGFALMCPEQEAKELAKIHKIYPPDLRQVFDRYYKMAQEKNLPNLAPPIYSKALLIDLVQQLEPETLQLGAQYLHNLKTHGHTSWYGWCVDKWGTKWDAYDLRPRVESKNALTFIYSTAWSPPMAALKDIAKTFEVAIATAYHDEGGNFSGSSIILPEGWSLPNEVFEQMPERVRINMQRTPEHKASCTQEITFSDREGRMSGILGDVNAAKKLLLLSAPEESLISDKTVNFLLRKIKNEQDLGSFLPSLLKKCPHFMGNANLLLHCAQEHPKMKPAYFFELMEQLQVSPHQTIPDLKKSFAQLWSLSGNLEGIVYAQRTAPEGYLTQAFYHALTSSSSDKLLQELCQVLQEVPINTVSPEVFKKFTLGFLYLALSPACDASLRQTIVKLAHKEHSHLTYRMQEKTKDLLPKIQALEEQGALEQVLHTAPASPKKRTL